MDLRMVALVVIVSLVCFGLSASVVRVLWPYLRGMKSGSRIAIGLYLLAVALALYVAVVDSFGRGFSSLILFWLAAFIAGFAAYLGMAYLHGTDEEK